MNLALPSSQLDQTVASHAAFTVSMMQMSPFGLSEQWLLRDCGDRHWELIAQALGQPNATFSDRSGRPVYAAFCATSLRFGEAAAQLGDRLERHSELFAVTASQLGSIHRLFNAAGEVARLEMISTFISHDDSGSNERVVRNAPVGELRPMPAPPSLVDLASRARQAARRARSDLETGPCILHIEPMPSLDFNAVGLLYFPTYSRIAEMARPAQTPLAARELFYFANIEMGDRLRVCEVPDGVVMMRGDGRVVAQVQTTHS